MTVEIEIKVESDKPDGEMAKPMEPQMSKDQLQAVLKGLLEKTGVKDPVAHQMKIDEIIKKISEIEDSEED